MGKGELYKIISCNYIILLCFIFLHTDMADAQSELKKPTVVENPTVVKTPEKKVSSKKTQSGQTKQKKSRSKTKKTTSKRRVSQPYLRISAESVNVGSSGGTWYLDIQTNCEWKIALSTASWGHLEKSGNRIILKVDENKAMTSRTDYFTLEAGGITKRVNIKQDGATTTAQNTTTASSGNNKNKYIISKSNNEGTTRKKRYFSTPYGSSSSSGSYNSYRYRSHHQFNEKKDDYMWGLSAGYFRKQWVLKANGVKTKEGMFGDDEYMNGVQFGLRFDPQFGYGIGINTGLFYEHCWADSDDDYDEYGSYHLTYREHGIYAPVHLKYTMNFSEWFQLSFFGGAGFNYVISGKLRAVDGNDESDAQDFFDDDDMKRFNIMLEYGASIRVKCVQIDFTMSQGITKWIDNEDLVMRQGRPFSVSASVAF